jgi:CYTH domain-containing protein
MFKRLRKKFAYKPDFQETQFINIVDTLLKHPKTSVVMTPLSNKYFVINESKHYYIKLQSPNIQFTNSKFSFAKSLNFKACDIITKMIHDVIEKDRQQIEDRIFTNEKCMLDSVISNLNK